VPEVFIRFLGTERKFAMAYLSCTCKKGEGMYEYASIIPNFYIAQYYNIAHSFTVHCAGQGLFFAR
jgi:hypothetical protein